MAIIEKVEASEQVISDYMSYGMSTIVDRALPKVEDGLLPVYRKILFSMWESKMTNDKDFCKCLDIIGSTAKYYVHGDSSLMGALAMLVDTNQTQMNPLICGHGNFGNALTQLGYSAPRYTFAKLSKFSEQLLFDGIDKGIVKMIGDAHKEPMYLPTMYPNILTMTESAIAVGESCNFNGFNLKDVCNYTSKYIKDKTLKASDYIIPDFPTKCQVIYNKNNIINICDNGRGSITLRGNYKYDKDNRILTFFVPHSTTVEKVLKEFVSKMNNFKEVVDVTDGSGFNKQTNEEEYAVDVMVKRNTDINILAEKIYKNTSLQSNVSYNMNCLIDFKPKVRGINEILDFWIPFRENYIKELLLNDIKTKSNKLHLMLGLKQVLLDIDEVIKIIRNAKEESILDDLMTKFKIDEIQAEYISKIRLRDINKNYITKQISQIDALEKEVEHLKYIVNNKDEIDNIIINQLNDISDKFGQPRKTEIIYEDDLQEISSDELIEDYNCRLILSSQGYLKKHLRQSDSHKLKDDDYIIQEIPSTNKSTILLFSDKGNRYKLNCYDLKTYEPKYYGDYTPNLIDLDKDERIISMASIENQEGYILSVYENGRIAKVDIKSFMSANKKLQNCCSDKSKLLDIKYIKNDVDIMLLSSEGKLLIVNSSNINPVTSKNSQGVVGMKLDDNIVINCIIDCNKDNKFTVTTKKGKTKEFSLDDIAPTNKPNEDRNIYNYCSGKRGNQGNFIWNLRNCNDEIIKAEIVED